MFCKQLVHASQPLLKCISPKHTIFKINEQSITFGKSPQADIMIKGFFIADIHTCLGKTDTGFVIVNIGRTSKTKVNGRPVKRSQLRSGDSIQVGRSSFIFLQ